MSSNSSPSLGRQQLAYRWSQRTLPYAEDGQFWACDSTAVAGGQNMVLPAAGSAV
jgi:hypothetical protein